MIRRRNHFATAMVVLALVGLAIRVAYVLMVERDDPIWGDAYFYHYAADLLVDGKGLIVPWNYLHGRDIVQAADHPPLFTLFLWVFSVVGLKSWLTHQLLTAALGASTIVAAGLLGRELAGERAGKLAAAVTAVYPLIWINDGLVMSESLVMPLVAWSILLSYRFARQPSLGRAAMLGGICALATLTRPEQILLVAIVGLPLTLLVAGADWRRRLVFAGVMGGTALAVLMPWFVRNTLTFEKPVLLSTNMDLTLAVSNCDETYGGQFFGFWYFDCAGRHQPLPGDQSEQSTYWRRLALDYISDHRDRVVPVVAARLGRFWNVYRPMQQVTFDEVEGRERWVSQAGLASFYVLVPIAVAGAVVLRRRRVRLLPLLAVPGIVTFAIAATFANTRYRAPAEVVIAVLAAVAIDAAIGRVRLGALPEAEVDVPEVLDPVPA